MCVCEIARLRILARDRVAKEIEKAGGKDRRTYIQKEKKERSEEERERERERERDRIKETARERVERHDDDRLERVLRAFKYRVLATEHGKTGERACAARRRGEGGGTPWHRRMRVPNHFLILLRRGLVYTRIGPFSFSVYKSRSAASGHDDAGICQVDF